MFSEAYDKCYNKVSFLAAWLLCWPMKLTFICNVVEGEQLLLPCRGGPKFIITYKLRNNEELRMLYSSPSIIRMNQVEEDEMRRARSTNGGEEE
jgi:hypothetical protein